MTNNVIFLLAKYGWKQLKKETLNVNFHNMSSNGLQVGHFVIA